MNLSAKHERQTNVVYSSFVGGLNTTTIPEMIAENQLAECINMEFNRTTGTLQNCCGTAMVFKCPDDITIDKLWYDEINNNFLFTDKSTRYIYTSRMVDMTGTHAYDRVKVGVLTGEHTPMAVMWEDGLVISSGGKLQYWDGLNLNTIGESPNVCNGVFVKNGRIWTWFEYTLMCSGVGDETNWKEDSSDDSSSKWLDVGYKEGEKEQAYITGACALSSDIVIIKNDGKIYRLAGDYPDWSLKEIARNITCLNPQCFVSIQNGVFLVGREGMFLLETTMDYGDVQPANVANGIIGLLGILSVEKSYVKFMPSLNQIWVAGYENTFICYDLTFKAFFQRKFNSPVNDICLYKNYFFLTRMHKVTELMNGIYQDEKYSDDESDMEWKIIAKSYTSFYEFLLKRMRLTYVPLMDNFMEAWLITADGRIKINIEEARRKSPLIFTDTTLIYADKSLIFPVHTQFVTKWMVYRNAILGICIEGKGSAIMLNRIESAIVEV